MNTKSIDISGIYSLDDLELILNDYADGLYRMKFVVCLKMGEIKATARTEREAGENMLKWLIENDEISQERIDKLEINKSWKDT